MSGHLSRTAETLGIGEPVRAAEAADGVAFVPEERQRRMRIQRVPERLELPVDGPLTERSLERQRIEKDVDVLRKPTDQIPAFRQARAALEYRLVASSAGDDASVTK